MSIKWFGFRGTNIETFFERKKFSGDFFGKKFVYSHPNQSILIMNNTHKASKPISYNQLLEYIRDDMIGKPFPYEEFDLEKAITEDESDEPAPEEWVQKMFPKFFSVEELRARIDESERQIAAGMVMDFDEAMDLIDQRLENKAK